MTQADNGTALLFFHCLTTWFFREREQDQDLRNIMSKKGFQLSPTSYASRLQSPLHQLSSPEGAVSWNSGAVGFTSGVISWTSGAYPALKTASLCAVCECIAWMSRVSCFQNAKCQCELSNLCCLENSALNMATETTVSKTLTDPWASECDMWPLKAQIFCLSSCRNNTNQQTCLQQAVCYNFGALRFLLCPRVVVPFPAPLRLLWKKWFGSLDARTKTDTYRSSSGSSCWVGNVEESFLLTGYIALLSNVVLHRSKSSLLSLARRNVVSFVCNAAHQPEVFVDSFSENVWELSRWTRMSLIVNVGVIYILNTSDTFLPKMEWKIVRCDGFVTSWLGSDRGFAVFPSCLVKIRKFDSGTASLWWFRLLWARGILKTRQPVHN